MNWEVTSHDLLLIALAYILGIVIGCERERTRRAGGLRTFPLVAVASCSYVLIGLHIFAEDPGAQARIVQGLMTGIGFIGGGAILKHGATVSGVASAASIWNTGAIGVAVAYSQFAIAVSLSLLNLLTLWLLTAYTSRKADPRSMSESGAL